MRILIVDDHEVVRRGVRGLLEKEDRFEICGEAVDGADAIAKAKELRPDSIVMDVSMPNMNGLDATREINRLLPRTRIVILSQHDSPEMVRQAMNAGASTYVVKSAISTELVAALESTSNTADSTLRRVFGSTNRNIDVQEILQRSAVFEAALRESGERFRVTFERAPIGVGHVSVEGRLLRGNRKLREILGYSEDEVRDLALGDISYPADRPALATQFAKVCAGEIDAYSVETRQVRKDGSVVWVNLTAAAVRDAEQKPKYVIAIIEDIDARKRVEEHLANRIRQQKALFHLADSLGRADSFDKVYTAAFDALFEGLPCNRAAILRSDSAHGMRFVSWRGLSSHDRATVEGDSAWLPGDRSPQPICIADTASASLDAPLRTALQSEGIRAAAFIPLVFGDSLVGKLMVYYNLPHIFEDEEIEFCQTICHQLAFGINRREADQALQEKASLLDLSSDAIVVRNFSDQIIYWSKGAIELYGYTEQEAMGRVTHELFATEFPESLEKIREQLHASGRWSGELVHTKKDGAKISVSSRWCLAYDSRADQKSILETNRDISAELALKKIRAEAVRKDDTKTPPLGLSPEIAIA
jgi:PAS domain S-box-containing protein